MTYRPILFSGAMVRAILSGAKTQTRRVVKPVRGCGQRRNICRPDMAADPWAVWWHGDVTERVGALQQCPYGKPGDCLWVRESFYVTSVCSHECGVGYKASHPTGKLSDGDGGYNFRYFSSDPDECGERWNWANRHSGIDRWIPGIHMPRWASRITLEITDIHVERLDDISETDAQAEGCSPTVITHQDLADLAISDESPTIKAIGKALGAGAFTSKFEFQMLWDSINARRGYGWSTNPWVWVIAFSSAKQKERAA